MPDPSSDVTMTLRRGLQLLRAFRADRTPLSNAELVRRTGLSRSSVSRLTSTLVSLGYLRRVSGGSRLELAWGSFDIGYAYTQSNPVTRLVNPVIQHLADELNVSVALAVPDQLDMLYIAYRTGPQITTLRLNVGSLLPMGLTSIGRAWLWALPPEERGRYLSAILEAAGPRAEMMKQRIHSAFDELDATGVNTAVNELQGHVYGIGVPLRIGRSGTLMAMNCGAADMKLEQDLTTIRNRTAPMLLQAAAEITARLRDIDAQP